MSQATWIITPPNYSPISRLQELWQGRRLLGFFVREALKWTYRRTAFGPFWMLFRPFMAVAVHLVFFALVLRVHGTEVPFPIYFLCGMLIWVSFDQAIVWSARSLETQRKLIAKIYFPRLILPVAYLAPAAVDFLVLLTILLSVIVTYAFVDGVVWLAFSWQTLIIFPVLLITTLFALGIALWAAPSALSSRDVIFSLRYVLGGWFLLTPVAYPDTFYKGALAWLPHVNPMAPLVTQFRNAIIGGPADLWSLLFPAACALTTVVSGYFYFIANDARAADRI